MELKPLVIDLIALADLHLRGLLAHHLVEHLGLAERTRDERDLVLVEIGDFLEQRVDGRRFDLFRHQAHLAQRRGGLVEILQGRFDYDVGHVQPSWPILPGASINQSA